MVDSKPIQVVLSPGEITELLKRTIGEQTKRLEEVERKLRELKREDAEMEKGRRMKRADSPSSFAPLREPLLRALTPLLLPPRSGSRRRGW